MRTTHVIPSRGGITWVIINLIVGGGVLGENLPHFRGEYLMLVFSDISMFWWS